MEGEVSERLSRRDLLKRAALFSGVGLAQTVSAADALVAQGSGPALTIAGHPVQIIVTSATPSTTRIRILPVVDGRLESVPIDGALDERVLSAPEPRPEAAVPDSAHVGDLVVSISKQPLTFRIQHKDGRTVQLLRVDSSTGEMTFALGDGPILGLGEGGPQFDRRGSTDRMRSGQGGYQLRTHGGRVPIPWLIGSSGWAMFIHHPIGTFDLTNIEGRFIPADVATALPLDVFVVGAREPAAILRGVRALTGYPEMPPLWSLGYQQSHRTLASREEILQEAKTFREKKLPCDTLIYLGTGFCPSGWNTDNGEFAFNKKCSPIRRKSCANFTPIISRLCCTRCSKAGR